MKKILLLPVLMLAAISLQAQSMDRPATLNNNAVCKSFPDMPANAVPIWPKGAYTPLEDPSCPPCYEYTSKHGTLRMECPYLQFPPEHENQAAVMEKQTNTGRSIQMQSENTYSGNYPSCKRFPDMPANAVPVWPKGAYTPLQDPSCPPCYEYTSKHGTLRMECPYLQFPPEHSRE
jgi:hypothetical protein